MRISELARTTGVPLATVKYYLREQLLHAGHATSATQAEYDRGHVRRLRLVRALVETGGLSLAAVREVLAAIDAGPGSDLEAIGRAHGSLPPGGVRVEDPARARALVAALGWDADPCSTALHRLEAALEALEAVGMAPSAEQVTAYGEAALLMARTDVASVPDADVAEVVEYVVAGTILYEPVILSLRRIAQQQLFVAGRPDG